MIESVRKTNLEVSHIKQKAQNCPTIHCQSTDKITINSQEQRQISWCSMELKIKLCKSNRDLPSKGSHELTLTRICYHQTASAYASCCPPLREPYICCERLGIFSFSTASLYVVSPPPISFSVCL